MRIVHSGPVSMYLSAVPSGQQIGQYDGSGEWVKIKTFGVEIHKDMKRPYWLPNNNTDKAYGSGTQNLPARVSSSIHDLRKCQKQTDANHCRCHSRSLTRLRRARTYFVLIWCSITGTHLRNCTLHAHRLLWRAVRLELCQRVSSSPKLMTLVCLVRLSAALLGTQCADNVV
jgi:hypothetical protein